MKSIMALSLLTLSFSTLACPNFNGTYQSPEDNKNFQIIQSGCEQISLNSPEINMTLPTDGVYHQVMAKDVIVYGKTLGKMIVTARTKFEADQLLFDVKNHTEMLGKITESNDFSVNTLAANGDLITVTTDEKGNVEKAISKRVK